MGRKPNLTPVGNLSLLFGSKVHWDQHRTKGRTGTQFLVTCGACKQQRWVYRGSIRKEFTGLCNSCAHKLAYKPPHVGQRNKKFTGKSRTQGGYITLAISMLSDTDQELANPMAQKNAREGRVLEHRLVMARHIERPLIKGETVHHISGEKTDNRIENLRLYAGNHGRGIDGFYQEYQEGLKEISRLQSILDKNSIPC